MNKHAISDDMYEYLSKTVEMAEYLSNECLGCDFNYEKSESMQVARDLIEHFVSFPLEELEIEMWELLGDIGSLAISNIEDESEEEMDEKS